MIENIVTRLRLITESADRYIEDGSWLEQLVEDIELANQALAEWDEAYPDLEADE